MENLNYASRSGLMHRDATLRPMRVVLTVHVSGLFLVLVRTTLWPWPRLDRSLASPDKNTHFVIDRLRLFQKVKSVKVGDNNSLTTSLAHRSIIVNLNSI